MSGIAITPCSSAKTGCNKPPIGHSIVFELLEEKQMFKKSPPPFVE